MAEYLYQDILIESGDVVLDAGRNPVLIHDRAVIAQDIKHAIIESNVAIHLIAERSPAKKSGRAHATRTSGRRRCSFGAWYGSHRRSKRWANLYFCRNGALWQRKHRGEL